MDLLRADLGLRTPPLPPPPPAPPLTPAQAAARARRWERLFLGLTVGGACLVAYGWAILWVPAVARAWSGPNEAFGGLANLFGAAFFLALGYLPLLIGAMTSGRQHARRSLALGLLAHLPWLGLLVPGW